MEKYDIVIAGAGISGLSLAHFCTKAGLNTLVLEKFKIGHIYSFVLAWFYHLTTPSLFIGSLGSCFAWLFSAKLMMRIFRLLSFDRALRLRLPEGPVDWEDLLLGPQRDDPAGLTGDPLLFLSACTEIPFGITEYDWAGGVRGTPYRVVKEGKVVSETKYLRADEEMSSVLAPPDIVEKDGHLKKGLVLARVNGDLATTVSKDVQYIDISPRQTVSVSAALIPFLEHDDANRALMGSNMQRQAVPLLYPRTPLVGTGLEEKVARDSGAVILARRGGTVTRVTADEIIIDTGAVKPGTTDEPLAKLAQFDRYKLKKYWRTNQDTAINQRPLVHLGEQVPLGAIIADGASTDHGELALGRNVLVAFMPWYGHNFEDAIVISEKLVKDDVFTSIHIQELELHVRDTKRGMEEITREIPNVAEESLTHLDERGIVRIGARVKAGDILVGKITPKGETELSPEEKLLTAIFGEKAKDVKDSSLKVPPGMEGTVIDVKVFSRRIDDPLLEKERGERIGQYRAYEREEIQRISEARDEELRELLKGQTVTLMLRKGTVEPYLDEKTKLTESKLDEVELSDIDLTTLKVQDRATNDRIRRLITEAKNRIERVREKIEEVKQQKTLADHVKKRADQLLAETVGQRLRDLRRGQPDGRCLVAVDGHVRPPPDRAEDPGRPRPAPGVRWPALSGGQNHGHCPEPARGRSHPGPASLPARAEDPHRRPPLGPEAGQRARSRAHRPLRERPGHSLCARRRGISSCA